MTFTVTSDITGDTKVNYALGITDIQEGATLTQDYIKIYLKKGNDVATGFTENKGELISTFRPLYIENITSLASDGTVKVSVSVTALINSELL